MTVIGIGMAEVERAAAKVGVEAVYRRTLPVSGEVEFSLRQKPGGEFSTGAGGVCLHGQAAFIKTLLQENPDATLRTRAGLYRGWADFEKYQSTISSRAARQFAPHQTCACSP